MFFDAKGEMLCKTNGFSNTWDAMNLHRYVQALVKDPARREQQSASGGCGRLEAG